MSGQSRSVVLSCASSGGSVVNPIVRSWSRARVPARKSGRPFVELPVLRIIRSQITRAAKCSTGNPVAIQSGAALSIKIGSAQNHEKFVTESSRIDDFSLTKTPLRGVPPAEKSGIPYAVRK